MLFAIFYNMLGVACLLVLLCCIKKLLKAFKKAAGPVPLRSKMLSLLLGVLAGLIAFVVGLYAALAVFLMMDWPSDELSMMILVYLAAGVSFASAYGLSRIIAMLYRRGMAKLTLYSALIIAGYFTLQPIGYNWLRLLFFS